MLTISLLLDKFLHASFQASLKRLHIDLGSQDPEEWAQHVCLALLYDPMDARAAGLNRDRKTCLDLLYKLVDTWEASPDPQAFEQDIVETFQVSRINQILSVCLVLDRAQALWKMQIPSSRFIGMHWFSKKMVEADSGYAQAFPVEHQALSSLLVGYPGFGTMNKRLFKVLFTDSFGLLRDPNLSRWSRPTKAAFFLADPSGYSSLQALTRDDLHPLAPPSSGYSQETPIPETTSSLFPGSLFCVQDPCEIQVQQFVEAYNNPSFQARLTRLYLDRGSNDPELWAKDLYLELLHNPGNHSLRMLNQDRKACLNLLYDLVNDWERNGFTDQYERAIQHVFKPRRISRILGVCLVMDRAQSIYRMILPNGKAGMHWFSELHFSPTGGWDTSLTEAERDQWKNEILVGYPGHGTMNKRLYRLIFNESFGLNQDEIFAKWSKPAFSA